VSLPAVVTIPVPSAAQLLPAQLKRGWLNLGLRVFAGCALTSTSKGAHSGYTRTTFPSWI